MKLLLTIEYNGNNFSGWQCQTNARSVQNEIEKVLNNLFQKEIKIHGSGRTDAGVHALGQTAHFEIDKILFDKKFKLSRFADSMNSLLPNDIKILKVKKVSNNFHARYDVKEKIYLYKLETNVKSPSPLLTGLVGTVKQSLDIEKMKQGASYLIGEHDFTSFSNSKTEVQNFTRTINYIKINKKGNIISLEISGNGFLYNMVRIIIGTLVDIGTCTINPEEMKHILDAKSRSMAGKTVSPSGLYLKKVVY
jgi:tRNA pseudouridine38-40 synthase